MLRRVPGQVGMQRFFTKSGRAFCLYVVLGSAGDAAALAEQASTLVAALAVT